MRSSRRTFATMTTQAVAKHTAGAIYSQRPPIQGREIDAAIRFATSGAHRGEGGKLYLINMPTETQRTLLAGRAKQLLDSFRHHDQGAIAALIADMLAAYDVAQVKQLTAADRKAAVVVYVRELRGVPTWAVQEACERIRLGTAPDISHAYKPTPIQVRVLAVSIAQPWKNEAIQIGELLAAEQYRAMPSAEERSAVGVKMQSLADAIREGTLGPPDGLRTQWDEMERENRERFAQRAGAISLEAIKREYAKHGESPAMAGNIVISRELAQQLRERPQAKAPAPETARGPAVDGTVPI
jgi:hypothetical protein